MRNIVFDRRAFRTFGSVIWGCKRDGDDRGISYLAKCAIRCSLCAYESIVAIHGRVDGAIDMVQ